MAYDDTGRIILNKKAEINKLVAESLRLPQDAPEKITIANKIKKLKNEIELLESGEKLSTDKISSRLKDLASEFNLGVPDDRKAEILAEVNELKRKLRDEKEKELKESEARISSMESELLRKLHERLGVTEAGAPAGAATGTTGDKTIAHVQGRPNIIRGKAVECGHETSFNLNAAVHYCGKCGKPITGVK